MKILTTALAFFGGILANSGLSLLIMLPSSLSDCLFFLPKLCTSSVVPSVLASDSQRTCELLSFTKQRQLPALFVNIAF